MKNFYYDYLTHYALSEREESAFQQLGEKYFELFEREIEGLIEVYYQNDCKIASVKESLEELVERDRNGYFELCFVFLVACAKRALGRFLEKGYSADLFYDTFSDLICKARECYRVYGVYGIFVPHWFTAFFNVKIFRLGRFQYEITSKSNVFEEDYRFEDVSTANTDTVLVVHIPSDGSMSRKSRMDSFAQAYAFFSDFHRNGKILFVCHSWLNYSRNAEFLPPESNARDFLNDWAAVRDEEDKNFKDCWRIFDVHYDGNPQALKRDTSLQRAIASWLEKGNHTGHGLGVCIFDGEKVLNGAR